MKVLVPTHPQIGMWEIAHNEAGVHEPAPTLDFAGLLEAAAAVCDERGEERLTVDSVA